MNVNFINLTGINSLFVVHFKQPLPNKQLQRFWNKIAKTKLLDVNDLFQLLYVKPKIIFCKFNHDLNVNKKANNKYCKVELLINCNYCHDYAISCILYCLTMHIIDIVKYSTTWILISSLISNKEAIKNIVALNIIYFDLVTTGNNRWYYRQVLLI